MVMKGGRCRWKIENQTFNILKTQDYEFEHSYGHGKQHLATVLAMLMMLAFLIDQVQEQGCAFFQAARRALSFADLAVDQNQRNFHRVVGGELGEVMGCYYLWPWGWITTVRSVVVE